MRYWFFGCIVQRGTRKAVDVWKMRHLNISDHYSLSLSLSLSVSLCLSLGSECSGPLGMEGGIISNQQITASSTHRALFGLQKWYPYFARLNRKGLVNAWTAAENDRWPWIQVTAPQSLEKMEFPTETDNHLIAFQRPEISRNAMTSQHSLSFSWIMEAYRALHQKQHTTTTNQKE